MMKSGNHMTLFRHPALVASVLCAGCGAIDIGDVGPLPPRLEVVRIDDGASGSAGGRSVSIGQTVRVLLEVANRGETDATNLSARLLFRHRDDGSPVDAVTQTEIWEPPGLLAPGHAATFGFAVRVMPSAEPGRWSVGARVDAAPSGGVPDAPEAVRRTWLVQRAAELRVTGVVTSVGDTSLGYTSINPGCAVEISAELRNEGEAAAEVHRAGVAFEGPSLGLETTSAAIAPSATIPGGGTATVTLRVEATPRVTRGSRVAARMFARATDVNSDAPLNLDPHTTPAVDLVASASRLGVAEVSPGRTESRAGDRGIPLRARVVYLPLSPSAVVLRRVAVELRFEPETANLPSQPEAQNPTELTGCPPRSPPCDGAWFGFTVDVPPDLPPGRVGVAAWVTGIDRASGQPDVVVCGGSDPSEPQSMAFIDLMP
jgi:hypothetical protein